MSKKNKVPYSCPDQINDCIFCMVNQHTGKREIEFGPLLNKVYHSRYLGSLFAIFCRLGGGRCPDNLGSDRQ